MNQQTSEAPQWDLEAVFPGGSKSSEYKAYRVKYKNELTELKTKFELAAAKTDLLSKDEIRELVNDLQNAYLKLDLIYSLSMCLTSVDVKDDTAFEILCEAQGYESEWENLKILLESFTLKIGEDDWNALLTESDMERISFYLKELREKAKIKMPPRMEALAVELAVNGYHAWNNIYTRMAGDYVVKFPEDGEIKQISLGQTALKMTNPDRNIRKIAFEKITEAWQENANLASLMLNSQAGFRLSLYRNRGWKSALFEPLLMGRLKEKSLNAMWKAVEEGTPGLIPFVEAKKKFLGIDKFYWYDQNAPVGKSSQVYTYNEAAQFVLEHLGAFSQDLQSFCTMALEKRWIEAENRSGKAAGAFCTSLGEAKESRVFMTFENNYNSLMTLAHELGHAYHHHVLRDDPVFAGFYPMGLAETASNFNELLVTDAALNQAHDDLEKLMLLDQRLSDGLIMFCNLYTRYIFDIQFYKERENGIVGKNRLNEIMIEAQKKAFCGILDSEDGYHPEFWASKLHFYETSMPFYHFPYTFGLLFSTAVYNKAKEEGSGFADSYRNLLRDTGSMSSEQLAKKHLDFDLADPAFWKWAVDKILEDVDPFVELVNKNM